MKILRGLTVLLVVGPAVGTGGGRVQARAHQFTTLGLPMAPATSNTSASEINQQGDIVGDYFDSKGHSHGFLLHQGTYTTIDGPKATTQNSRSDAGRHTFKITFRAAGLETLTVSDDTAASAGDPLSAATRLTVSPVRMPANPVAAVKLLVPFRGQRANVTSPCYSAPARYLQARGCPVTLRLQRRLRNLTIPRPYAGGGNPICRCQNFPLSIGYHLDHMGGGQAQVRVTFYFVPPEPMTFRLERFSIGWLVQDIYCAGRPATSIYSPRWGADCSNRQSTAAEWRPMRVSGSRS